MTRLNRIIISICIVLLAVFCITTGMVAGLYAKNKSSGKHADQASVAGFVFDVSEEDQEVFADLSSVDAPGKSDTYTVTVTSTSGGTSSEVAIDYDMTFSLNGNMPLTVSVLQNGSVLKSITIDSTTTVFPQTMTVSGTLEVGASGKTYVIKAEWPTSRNDSGYSSGATASSIGMKVTAVQED